MSNCGDTAQNAARSSQEDTARKPVVIHRDVAVKKWDPVYDDGPVPKYRAIEFPTMEINQKPSPVATALNL